MKEDAARNFYLVRAIELEDREHALLTAEDLAQADLKARPFLGKYDRSGSAAYLAHRATFAAGRLATRFPLVRRALSLARWPAALNWGVPLALFVAGAMANELGNGRRLDLLALPLLGTLVWNVLLYLWLLLLPLLKPRRQAQLPLAARLAGWLSGLGQRRRNRATALSRGLDRFLRDWGAAAAPLTVARVRRTLHLGAALFGLGLVASIYVRALAVEYRAGWESTFLNAEAVHAILAALLGPASALTGIPLPPPEGMAALRWTAGGDNAGMWIHLYSATLLGIVVAPRLLLAAGQALKAYRLATWFPTPGRDDFYTRRLLRTASDAPLRVRVTPYACTPAPEVRHGFKTLLAEALGDRAKVFFDEPVIYGAEDEWLEQTTLRPDDDYHILLFALSSTPEAETHGKMASALRERLSRERNGTTLAAVLETSGFHRQFGQLAGYAARIDQRRQVWETVLRAAGVSPIPLDLTASDMEAASRLEALLMQNPALEG